MRRVKRGADGVVSSAPNRPPRPLLSKVASQSIKIFFDFFVVAGGESLKPLRNIPNEPSSLKGRDQ